MPKAQSAPAPTRWASCSTQRARAGFPGRRGRPDRPPAATIATVGVLVDPPTDLVRQTIDCSGVNALQFHGDETPQFCAQFGLKTIKAFRLRDRTALAALQAHPQSAWLLDSYVPGLPRRLRPDVQLGPRHRGQTTGQPNLPRRGIDSGEHSRGDPARRALQRAIYRVASKPHPDAKIPLGSAGSSRTRGPRRSEPPLREKTPNTGPILLLSSKRV